MTGRPRADWLDRENSCVVKTRHASAAAARAFLAAFNRNRPRGKRRDPRGALEVYRCRYCGGYHVGHAPKKRKEKR